MGLYSLLPVILLLLIFSFLHTKFRSYAIAGIGCIFGVYLIMEAAKEKGPAPHTMAGMGQGLGAAYFFAFLLGMFLLYDITLSIMVWQQRKRQKTVAAQQIKKGLYYSNGLLLLCFIVSVLNIPQRIIEHRQLSRVQLAFDNTWQLLSDSIKSDSNNFQLYFKRASITGHFTDTLTGYSYPFGNDAEKISDIKKAFALRQDDYSFLSALSNLLPYDVDYVNNKEISIKAKRTTAVTDPANMIWDSIGLAIGKKANALLLDSLQKQIGQYPQKIKWLYERGNLYKKMGDTSMAMVDFESLNQLVPVNDYGTEKELAEYYLRTGATEKSNVYYRKYIGAAVFKEGPFNFLSERAALKEEIAPKEAIVDYKAALVLQPNDFGTKKKIMDLFLSMGDSSNADSYSK
jgi:tetratricopeptide (TPR) repeat protein